MTRKLFTLAVALVPALTFALGLPKPPGAGAGGGGLTAAQIDSFVEKAAVADAEMNTSASKLFDAVASKEQRQELEAKRDAANKIQDPKEKEAALKKIDGDVSTALAASDWDKEISARVSQLSADQLKSVGDAAGAFVLAAAANVGLVRQGQEMAKQKPEMTATPKMPALTASLGNLVNQMKGAVNVASGIQKLMKSSKIQLPAEATASFAKLTEGV